MNRTSGEMKPLTSLRAVAAGLVFFYHVIYLRHQVPAKNVFEAIIQSGFIGVTIFFVLSAFLLTLRYYDEVRSGSFHWGMYLKRRVARIYPLYFLLLAGIALWGVHLNITNATLTQGFFSRLYQTGIIVAWTLTAEECFYLMLPFVLSILVKFQRLSSTAIILLVWSVAMLGVGSLLMNWSNWDGWARQAGFMNDWTYVLHRTVFGYIFDFSVGIFAAILHLKRDRQPYSVPVSTVLAVVGVVGIVIFQVLMVRYPDPMSERVLMYGAAIFVGVLITSLTCKSMVLSRVMSWSPLVYMGRISYALYLIQLTQLLWFMANWNPVLFYIGSSLISALLYTFFEEPVRKLILRKREARPTPPPVLRRETELAHGSMD